MPANLTPEYLEAERVFKEAGSTEEKIEALDKMMAVIPKHKGTDKMRAMLRRRMSRLMDETRKRGGVRKAYDPYLIRREGAGQIALWGLPNSGKSSIVSSLTRAACLVTEYPFATRKPTPGMMSFENISIQLVDLPPLMDEASESWMPRVLRRADAYAFILDGAEDVITQMELLVEGLLEMKIPGVPGKEGSADGPDSGDLIRGFICLNKSDLVKNVEEVLDGLSSWPFRKIAISARDPESMNSFRETSFLSLEIMRVYTKAPHKNVSYKDPIILKVGATLDDAARSLHKDFAYGMKYARVWGEDFFDGQMIGRDQVLSDGTVIELHT